jgi:hypothetical protein
MRERVRMGFQLSLSGSIALNLISRDFPDLGLAALWLLESLGIAIDFFSRNLAYL